MTQDFKEPIQPVSKRARVQHEWASAVLRLRVEPGFIPAILKCLCYLPRFPKNK